MARGRRQRPGVRASVWRGVLACGAAVVAMTMPAMSGKGMAAQADVARDVRFVNEPGGTVRAQLTVRHRQAKGDGRLTRPEGPPMLMRLVREQVKGKWRTTLTFTAEPPVIARSGTDLFAMSNPFAAGRVEYDEGAAEPRVYDANGRQVALPAERERRLFGISDEQRAPGWELRARASRGRTPIPAAFDPANVYVDGARHDNRRADIQRAFGRSVGRVRGLDRYVKTEAGETRELLVPPDTQLPIEFNVAQNGTLRSRLELQHARAANDVMVRRALRAERLAGPAASDDRVVTEVTFANIEIARGGAR